MERLKAECGRVLMAAKHKWAPFKSLEELSWRRDRRWWWWWMQSHTDLHRCRQSGKRQNLGGNKMRKDILMRDAGFQVSFCECDFYQDEMPKGSYPKFFGFTSCFHLVKSPDKGFGEGRYFLGNTLINK